MRSRSTASGSRSARCSRSTRRHLSRLKALCDRYQPESFSEHLAWSSHDNVFLNDLLPLPYTGNDIGADLRAYRRGANHLGRQMLLENPATYLLFAESTIPETEFLREIARRTGCGLLLDVNNVFVASASIMGSIRGPISRLFRSTHVREIHLGGHSRDGGRDRCGASHRHA